MDITDILCPGDLLLYRPKKGSIFGHLIAIKTWSAISHCEVYLGGGKSAASRDGVGVGRYPVRASELAYVLRPLAPPLDWSAYAAWFKTVDGSGYDFFGLLRFVWMKSIGTGDNGKMFCSEFCVRAYRMLGMEPFTAVVDADAVAPCNFLLSSKFAIVATPTSLASTLVPI